QFPHVEEEHATFLRYAETTKINSTLFDHTGSGDTHYAVRLNGSESERIGLARSLAVMTGDTMRAEVYAKYLDPDPSNWTAALHDLMAAIAAGTAPTGTVVEAVPPSGGDAFPFAGLLDAAKAGDTGTRAYLNILLFDENLGFLDAAYVPVSMAAREDGTGVPHERLAEETVVQQPGYAYIYFSNDSDQPLEVFFDDFTVEHVNSAIVQADDYYPFGMGIASLSHRRENAFLNNYLYQGDFSEKSDLTGWNSFYLRNYDSQIGRWTSVDPYDQYPSPYMGRGNDPINTIDPDGGFGIGVGAAQIALGAYSVYRAYDQGGIHAVGQSLMMGFLSGLGGGYNPASMGEGIAHGVVS